MTSQETPHSLGYRMPAEWEPHAATWLAWPHNLDTWPGKFEPIPGVWTHLVKTLSRFEPVHLLAGGEAVMKQARDCVGHLPNVFLHDIPTNDVWMRDHGPMFLVGEPGAPPVLVDWKYNAWGGKYPPFDLDDQVPAKIASLLNYRRFAVDIVMEGGSLDVNGQGSVLTTEQCLLNPNRNPGLTRKQIERYLLDYCGTRHVIWLGGGIVGDDTDGHIDELARFVNPRTIVAMVEEDKSDENHEPLFDNLARLKHSADQDGRPLEVVPLRMPKPCFYGENRLPASYANFYIANGCVLVPQYNDPADAAAVETLAKLFPDRQIIGLPALDLSWGLGAYHCISQQQPRGD